MSCWGGFSVWTVTELEIVATEDEIEELEGEEVNADATEWYCEEVQNSVR